MSHAEAPPELSLRERKRQATEARIAGEAARLVSANGLAGTTVDQIAAAADVGRATFFRYFDTKEAAVAAGFATSWTRVIADELALQPADLDPIAAVRAAFAQLAPVLAREHDLILLQARLARSSDTLHAWTLHLHLRIERAVAALVAPRFEGLEPNDARPQLVGALATAVVRIAVDEWVASDGTADLPELIDDGLASVSISTTRRPTR